MKELNINEIKEIELRILEYVSRVCEENNIEYSLCGGTLLGAVRHKGFIPWDDDIDIFMTRDNYQKFIKLFGDIKNGNYQIINYENTDGFNYLFSKIVDKRTRLIEEHSFNLEKMGVFIDVFPIDSLANTIDEAKRKLKKVRFKKYLGVASNWRHFFLNKNRSSLRQIPRFLFYLMSRRFDAKKNYHKIESFFPYSASCSFFGAVAGVYENKEIMPKSVFLSHTYMKFENLELMVIADYDQYLKRLYGDYMELPPIEKRTTHHTFKAYWRNYD